eukprot:839977_1
MSQQLNKCAGDTVKECESIQRILRLMMQYKNQTETEENSQHMDKINDYQTYINDYHHILDKHLNEDRISAAQCNQQFELIQQQMIDNNLSCDINKCKIYTRNNRARELDAIEVKHSENESEHVLVNLLDNMHCYFIHSIDIGYRVIRGLNHEHKQKDSDNMVYDSRIEHLKSYLKSRRENLKQTRGENRFTNNKFTTCLLTSSIENANDVDSKTDGGVTAVESGSNTEDDTQYRFGAKLDYWSNTHQPKYASLKEELIANKIYKIEIHIFDKAYKKAEYLVQKAERIKSIKSNREEYYGIAHNSLLSVDNVLSVLFYTDFDTLSYNFSRTFRKISPQETMQELKARNSEYWHWSKLLIETVNCWGYSMRQCKISAFYHGVSKVYFNAFVTRFSSPTSTTTQLSVAAIFARNSGIILELHRFNQQGGGYLRYLNCLWFSCFPNEDERLFISSPSHGLSYLQFVSIRNLDTNENYQVFIRAMTILEQIIKGYKVNVKLSSLDVVIIKHLLEYSLTPTATATTNEIQTDHKQFPEYILKTFTKWKNRRSRVHINLKYLDNASARLSKIFVVQSSDTNGCLLCLDKINAIFQNIDEIECEETGVVSSAFIMTLLEMVDKINAIESSKLDLIEFCDIKNMSELKAFEKYQSLFQQKNWTIEKSKISLTLSKIL